MKPTIKRYYQVARDQIAYVKFIIEAYDNLAVVSTVDAYQAIIRITMPPGGEALVSAILADLAGDGEITALSEAQALGSKPEKVPADGGRPRTARSNGKEAEPNR